MMASFGGKVVAPDKRLGEANPIRVEAVSRWSGSSRGKTKVEPETRAPDPASIWNSCRKAATFCNQIGRELGRTKGRLGLRRGHYYRSRKPKIVAVPQRHGVARSLSMLRRKSIDSRISKP